MPPDNSLGKKFSKPLRPTISIRRRLCASASACFTPCWRGPYITLPSTLFGTGPDDRLTLHLRQALRRIDKATDDIEQRRFSAAGRPENGDEGAILDRQRDIRQRQMILTAGSAKNLRDPVDLDHSRRRLARRRGLRLNIRPRWQYLHSRFSSRRTATFPKFFVPRRSIAETRGAWRCCFEGRPTGTGGTGRKQDGKFILE